METAIVRRRKVKKRTGRRSNPLSKIERRRLIQLGISLAVFALAFLGRNTFPERISQWNERLRQDADFVSAFSQFGQALSRGEPVMETLEGLWVEVFAGGGASVGYSITPDFVERCRTGGQLDHPILAWFRSQKVESVPSTGSVQGVEDAQSEVGQATIHTGGEGDSGELLQTTNQTAVPSLETAVAQETDPDGQALPASISFKEYALGLNGLTTPVLGSLTSDYGYRNHPVSGEYGFHRGVDIGAETGTPIAAFASGVVDCVGESDESGLYIQLDHGNGVKSFYAHCSEIYVPKGEEVELGETVATVGETGNATGPHLHFSIIKDGIYLDPLFYIQVG